MGCSLNKTNKINKNIIINNKINENNKIINKNIIKFNLKLISTNKNNILIQILKVVCSERIYHENIHKITIQRVKLFYFSFSLISYLFYFNFLYFLYFFLS